MKQGQIVFRFLFPSRQYAPKPIHPAMCPRYNPATSLETSLMLNRLCLFATRADMGHIAKLFYQVSYLTRVIAFIKAHSLLFPLGRLRSCYRNAFYRRLGHFAIMPIRPLNRQANRYTRAFCEQTAFNIFFGPVGGIGAGFFPRRGGPWSWRHPWIAKTNRSLSIHHNLSKPFPTACRTHRLWSILETASERYYWNKYPFRLTRSIGNRFSGRKRFRPWPCGLAPWADRRQNDGYSYAWATTALFFPIIRLKSYICSLFFACSSLNPFKGTTAFEYIGYSGVIRIGS